MCEIIDRWVSRGRDKRQGGKRQGQKAGGQEARGYNLWIVIYFIDGDTKTTHAKTNEQQKRYIIHNTLK